MTSSDVILIDGGFETELRKYVGSGFEGHYLWTSRYLKENPDACRKAIRKYTKSGADIIMTNTYQATVDGFQKHWDISRDEAVELIKKAVTLCREAIQLEKQEGNLKPVVVAGCVGPYGAYLHDGSEYAGGNYVDTMTLEELTAWHRPRIEALIEAGSDVLFFVTVPSLKEAEALILLLKQHPTIKALLSFSAQNDSTISHGEKLSDAALRCWELADGQLMAVGINCLHPRLTLPLLQSVKVNHPQIPLLVKANTTEEFNTTTKQWELKDTEKSLPEYCQEWLKLGVKYISGCCRTTIEDISSFREEIEKFKHKVN